MMVSKRKSKDYFEIRHRRGEVAEIISGDILYIAWQIKIDSNAYGILYYRNYIRRIE